MKLRNEIEGIVGSTYRHALFYNFPGGLRFELSEGTSPLDQALSALRKATVVCEDIFAGEARMLVHLMTPAPESLFALRFMIRQLRIAGVIFPKMREFWLDEDKETDEEPFCFVNCAFEVAAHKLQNLLWCAITPDLGLRPRPGCLIYLLNPAKGIVVHPYDDRGLDVIGRNASSLAGLYERHNHLLLDFDMTAMRQAFASS